MPSLPLTREQAISLLKSMPQTQEEINHYLETEAIMKEIALKLNEDVEYYGMLGLLHDVDWALTKNNVKEHCILAQKILREKGFDEQFIEAIQSHGYDFEQIPSLINKKRTKKEEFCLASAETLTGIIYAYALMRGRKISDMEVSGLKKKFKDKRFAANCNREIVREIEQAGINLDEFFALAIKAMISIKNEIGLG